MPTKVVGGRISVFKTVTKLYSALFAHSMLCVEAKRDLSIRKFSSSMPSPRTGAQKRALV